MYSSCLQDEKNQILTTNCWLTQIWTDHHLKWNVSDFAGIKVIRVPYQRVWRPDVILYNKTQEFLSTDTEVLGSIPGAYIFSVKHADSQYNSAVINTNVIVTYTGEVVWLSHGIFRSSCDINVEYFPFDIQSCNMKWASWTYDGYQCYLSIVVARGVLSVVYGPFVAPLTLKLGMLASCSESDVLCPQLDLLKQTEAGDVSNYQANGEFDLVSFDAVKHVEFYSCCPEPYPDITYIIRLRRRPMFYVFNLILPCILINGIALLVFYVPSESGEKVTLGISALLSMTVFLMTIRESLPPTEKTPLISKL
uniref:Uncharacterized protein n=1 Tax=Timema tahoe TaxID=61484 RepID=A0A7R9IBE0_9NEOP|nr:unnamed protein product [Timema tahoe]